MERFRFLLVPIFTLISLLLNCRVADKNAAIFWENSNAINDAMDIAFRGTNFLSILQGSLNPKDEFLLYAVDEDNLYFAVEGRREGGKWTIRKVRSSNPNSEFSSKAMFTKTLSGDDELYEVYRKQYARTGNASPSITFKGIAALIASGPSPSKTQEFLCKTMDCTEDTSASGRVLTYGFSDKTKKTYPAFYKKLSQRLGIMEFECRGIPDSVDSAAILVSNKGDRIVIRLPSAPFSKNWLNPKNIRMSLNLTIRTYGITLRITGMKYQLSYIKSSKSETLSGRFVGLPDSKIEGRFFYVIPQGLVNLFIPDDIESYLKKGIQLISVGSDGKKGNRFTIQYGGEGKNAYYDSRSHSEVYRKRFSLFGEKKPEEDEGVGNQKVFFRDLNDAIRQDLAGQAR